MKVAQGKEGWLFLDNDTNNIVSQLNGELTFSPKDLYQWKLLLEMRRAWMNQHNISHFYTVIPNKACVYPEYLPDSIQLSERRCINQLIEYLDHYSFSKLIYPLPELLQAKQEMLVYRLTDTHWTAFGAYIGYLALISEISKSHPVYIVPRSSIVFEVYDDPISDLGSKVGIDGGASIKASLTNQKAQCILDNQIVANGHAQIYDNPDKSLPKAVLFRDSFGNSMLDFLAESFSRLVVVWQPHIDYSVIEAEKPDVVINQQVERFLVRIPDDLKGPSHNEIVQAKLSHADWADSF
jgi:alginate O-acetyltransferase complex protein AlgJ